MGIGLGLKSFALLRWIAVTNLDAISLGLMRLSASQEKQFVRMKRKNWCGGVVRAWDP